MQVKDELCAYQMDSTISILRDVAKSGEDRLLQVKKHMSSLARALRKLSSAFSHLKENGGLVRSRGPLYMGLARIRKRKGDQIRTVRQLKAMSL